MSQQVLTISPGNDEDILWSFASRGATGAFINTGITVTMSLFAPGDDPDTATPITGAANLPMGYQDDSNGLYLGTLPHTLSLTVGSGYKLRITATGSLHARITLDVTVVDRTS
jgi:hypothetical protein